MSALSSTSDRLRRVPPSARPTRGGTSACCASSPTRGSSEGNAFLSSPGPGAYGIAQQVIATIKPWLVGADPLDIGAHARRMEGLRHYLSPHAIGVTDVALWDIAGKA